MSVGILVALAREGRIVDAASRRGGVQAVLLQVSGVGPHRARAAAEVLVARGARMLLSVGFAGAIADGLSAGDLLLPVQVCDEDGACMPTCAATVGVVRRHLDGTLTVHGGNLVSVARVVAGAGSKRELCTRSGAVAVDMESAAVGAVAMGAGIPFAAVRSISDAVHDAIPRCALDGVDAFGRVRPLIMARALAGRPREIVPLLRLGRGVRAAGDSLARTLDSALPALCEAAAQPR